MVNYHVCSLLSGNYETGKSNNIIRVRYTAASDPPRRRTESVVYNAFIKNAGQRNAYAYSSRTRAYMSVTSNVLTVVRGIKPPTNIFKKN